MIGFLSLAVYVIAALVVAHYGQNTRAGYAGTFVLSLLLTPIVTGVMLIAFGDRPSRQPPSAPAAE